jgi:hypothetical protein
MPSNGILFRDSYCYEQGAEACIDGPMDDI